MKARFNNGNSIGGGGMVGGLPSRIVWECSTAVQFIASFAAVGGSHGMNQAQIATTDASEGRAMGDVLLL